VSSDQSEEVTRLTTSSAFQLRSTASCLHTSHATIVGLIAEVAERDPQRAALLDSISDHAVVYGSLLEKSGAWLGVAASARCGARNAPSRPCRKLVGVGDCRARHL
jgi:hypothetical protein